MVMCEQNLYGFLGVERNAPDQIVQAAFRKKRSEICQMDPRTKEGTLALIGYTQACGIFFERNMFGLGPAVTGRARYDMYLDGAYEEDSFHHQFIKDIFAGEYDVFTSKEYRFLMQDMFKNQNIDFRLENRAEVYYGALLFSPYVPLETLNAAIFSFSWQPPVRVNGRGEVDEDLSLQQNHMFVAALCEALEQKRDEIESSKSGPFTGHLSAICGCIKYGLHRDEVIPIFEKLLSFNNAEIKNSIATFLARETWQAKPPDSEGERAYRYAKGLVSFAQKAVAADADYYLTHPGFVDEFFKVCTHHLHDQEMRRFAAVLLTGDSNAESTVERIGPLIPPAGKAVSAFFDVALGGKKPNFWMSLATRAEHCFSRLGLH